MKATCQEGGIERACEDAAVGRDGLLSAWLLFRIMLSSVALLLLAAVTLACLRSVDLHAPLLSNPRWSACACPCF